MRLRGNFDLRCHFEEFQLGGSLDGFLCDKIQYQKLLKFSAFLKIT